MKKILVAVRDVKAEFFSEPWTTDSKGAAIRSFLDAVNDAQTMISKHPEDFALYQVGEFDKLTGKVVAFDTPVHLCNATELVNHG